MSKTLVNAVGNLDIAVLRTLLAIERYGTFARAAAAVGRSESAVSLQLKRLEEQIGHPLFHRAGRGMELTGAGLTMLDYAKRMVDLNDEALTTASGARVEGRIRLGVPLDIAETWLPPALARFGRINPAVLVETTVDRGPVLKALLDRGDLDLAMVFAAEAPEGARWIGALPMTWIVPRDFQYAPNEDVRLAVFDPPCAFRGAATFALNAAGLRWSVSFTSPSLASLWAAVDAGLGITVRTPEGLPPGLMTVRKDQGLPPLPSVMLALFESAEKNPAANRLAEVLAMTLGSTLGAAL